MSFERQREKSNNNFVPQPRLIDGGWGQVVSRQFVWRQKKLALFHNFKAGL